MDLKSYIRDIPNYPVEGIIFKDITTLLKEPAPFKSVVDSIYNAVKHHGITKVVTLESRGFIIGGALAYRLDAGFVPIRKKGKLPYKIFSQTYALEYGTDTIEIHQDALNENDVVLIHDDLLATAGTATAALSLVQKFNVKKVIFSFIVDLTFIESPSKTALYQYDTHSLINY